MTDIILEVIRAIAVAAILIIFLKVGYAKSIFNIDGWRHIVTGFALIFFGTLIDITDNYPGLNKFILIGDTIVQSFLEKVIGYLLGFIVLAYGIGKCLPKLAELTELKKLEVSKQRLKVLRATMRTVLDIVNNFLNNVQYFKFRAEQENALPRELLEELESGIRDTGKIKKAWGSRVDT
ncbi:MAG: hypothetical protein HKO91_01670 [Desulfobacterales bacterium]|nr:hypothetical protein [Desulfobacterales bacterium]